mmetsp:Transcript_72620/g.175199  ORF Transcript_72620/g.175199 Transcript_72620/m.175199 type:complete len:207 (-) Transcript_72620:9-629(-)
MQQLPLAAYKRLPPFAGRRVLQCRDRRGVSLLLRQHERGVTMIIGCVHVQARRGHQRLDRLGAAVKGCQHEGRVARPSVYRVHVQLRSSQKRRDRLGVAFNRRHHECRVVVHRIRLVHFEARCRSQQCRDRSGAALARRHHERSAAFMTACRIHVEARRRKQQRRDRFGEPCARRHHECLSLLGTPEPVRHSSSRPPGGWLVLKID